MNTDRHHGPPPDGMIGPRIMYLQKLMCQAFNKAAAEEGLFSGQQYIVLAIVANEGMTLSELSKKLDITGASASVSVKRMEKAGFIEKRADENDARIIRLYPTKKAKAAPKNIKEKMDSFESILKKGMSEAEGLELSRLLDLATRNMAERGEVDA